MPRYVSDTFVQSLRISPPEIFVSITRSGKGILRKRSPPSSVKFLPMARGEDSLRLSVDAYHEASDNAPAATGGVALPRIDMQKHRGGSEQRGGRVHNLAIDGLVGPGGRCTKAHAYTSYPSFHEESQYLPGTRPLMKSIDLLQISAYRSKPVCKRSDHERDRGRRETGREAPFRRTTRTSRGTSNVYAPLNSSPVWRLSLYESFSSFFFFFSNDDPRDDFLHLPIVTPTPLSKETPSSAPSCLGSSLCGMDDRREWRDGWNLILDCRISWCWLYV